LGILQSSSYLYWMLLGFLGMPFTPERPNSKRYIQRAHPKGKGFFALCVNIRQITNILFHQAENRR